MSNSDVKRGLRIDFLFSKFPEKCVEAVELDAEISEASSEYDPIKVIGTELKLKV